MMIMMMMTHTYSNKLPVICILHILWDRKRGISLRKFRKFKQHSAPAHRMRAQPSNCLVARCRTSYYVYSTQTVAFRHSKT